MKRLLLVITLVAALWPLSASAQNLCPTGIARCYTVEPGDSLSLIAQKHGHSDWQTIQKDNHIIGTKIYPGQVLKIRSSWPYPIQLLSSEVEKELFVGSDYGLFAYFVSPGGEKFAFIEGNLFNFPTTAGNGTSDWVNRTWDPRGIKIPKDYCGTFYQISVTICNNAVTFIEAAEFRIPEFGGAVHYLPSNTPTTIALKPDTNSVQLPLHYISSRYDPKTSRVFNAGWELRYDPVAGIWRFHLEAMVVYRIERVDNWPWLPPGGRTYILEEPDKASDWMVQGMIFIVTNP